jgi:ketol-acid reductoisomerase
LHGYAAALGGMLRSMTIDREPMTESMRQALAQIQDGTFARKLREEVDKGYPSRALLEAMLSKENLITQVEDALYGKLDGSS